MTTSGAPRAPRKVEIDFMSRLDVYRKRPRNWTMDKGTPVIPTKWANVSKGDAKRPERGKELKPTKPGICASLGPFECVMFMLCEALIWKRGASGASARRILFDASRTHCQVDATCEMAIELPPEEQAKGGDLIGEILKSLFGTRKAAHNWEKNWQRVLIDSASVIYTWSPAIVCCRERELCGFVHGDDFMITGHSMQLVRGESHLNEGLIVKRRAILGPDDSTDMTVTILNRLVTWVCPSGSRNQIEIVKVQEWTPQMPGGERGCIFHSRTARKSMEHA